MSGLGPASSGITAPPGAAALQEEEDQPVAASCPSAAAPACIPGSSSAVAAGGASRAVSGAAHVPAPPSRPGPAGPPPAASGCSLSCRGSRLLLRTRPNDSRVTPRSRPDALRKGRHFCRGGFAQGVITGKVFVRLRKRKKESRSGSRPPSPALAPVSGFQPSPLATRKTRPDAGCAKSHVRAGRVSRTRKGFKKSLQVLQGEIFSSANRFSK